MASAVFFGGNVSFNCGPDPVTITLSSRISLGAKTRIDGGGLVTLSGNDATSLLHISHGVKVNLSRLALSDSVDNGILNFGKLTISDCRFASHEEAAIYSSGSLTVSNSTFEDNRSAAPGSAISLYQGKLKATNCTFSNNSELAIYADFSKIALSSCTFSANSGGDRLDGAAVSAFDTSVKIANSTFSNNTSNSPGVVVVGGSKKVSVSNSTFANNTGAIQSKTTVALKGTLLAANSPDPCSGDDGIFVDKGYNLIDTAGCGLTTEEGSLIGVDPMVSGSLADHGGSTETIALDPNSPAKDVAKCTKTDQRGYVRPGTGAEHCTIGAYEINSAGCPSKLSACGSPQICINLAKDVNNCGTCGNVCASGMACSGGECVAW